MYKTAEERQLGKLLSSIKKRCKATAPCHHNYYDRGITVCKEWLESTESFIQWALLANYKLGLEIDRIDNNKGYEPTNCRFVTRSVNSQNRRLLDRNTSGYIGVHYHIKNKCYIATICLQNQIKHLGSFNTALEAAKAYDTFVLDNKTMHTLNNVIKQDSDKTYSSSRSRNNTSGVKGIDYQIRTNSWRVRVTINGKRKTLGYFKIKKDAIKELEKWKEIRSNDAT